MNRKPRILDHLLTLWIRFDVTFVSSRPRRVSSYFGDRISYFIFHFGQASYLKICWLYRFNIRSLDLKICAYIWRLLKDSVFKCKLLFDWTVRLSFILLVHVLFYHKCFSYYYNFGSCSSSSLLENQDRAEWISASSFFFFYSRMCNWFYTEYVRRFRSSHVGVPEEYLFSLRLKNYMSS